MSWFQELAGKAENILNKIDQNAATVLHQKIDKQETTLSDLQEVKCEPTLTPIREIKPKNMLSLKSSPILNVPKSHIDKIFIEKQELVDSIDEVTVENEKIPQSRSNSTSRRSSLSSRADGTVIETFNQSTILSQHKYPNEADGLEQELRALKIVLNQIERERDEARMDLELAQEQIKNSNTKTIINELEELCVQLREDKMTIIHK